MFIRKTFRGREPGLNDLLQWAALVESGVVQCKDGSLLAGWFYDAPDIASLTDEARNYYAGRINAALSRLGSGWATWTECFRVPAPGYPPAEASHFPDPVSRLVDAERRLQFTTGHHFSTGHALLVQFTPPLRIQRRLADLLYTGGTDGDAGLASRILREFAAALDVLESAIGSDVIILHRMRTYPVADEWGRSHHRDSLVDFLQFALSGEPSSLNLPPDGAYLDCVLGGRHLFTGNPLALGGNYVRIIGIDGFPAESWPQILDALNHLPLAYRWSTRMLYLDQHEALGNLQKFRRHWKQQVRGFWSQVFKLQSGHVNEDALLMTDQAGSAIAEASSGLVTFGFYTSVVVLTGPDLDEIEDASKTVREVLQRIGFGARIETDNGPEAWLGSLPGHVLPNVRRPHLHTALLADLMPLSAPWTGEAEAPCPFYPPGSPPLLQAVTTGATPFALNLHVGDVGHTLVLGPTGAGKSVLLAAIALSALRYPGASICAFDKGRSLYATAKACGGRHCDIARDDRGPAFSPLAALDTDEDAAWAEGWIATCFQLQHGREPSPGEQAAIHRAIALLRREGTLRTLSHFAAMVSSQPVRDALGYYTVTGTAGRLFDARADGIEASHFTVFEIEELIALEAKASIPALLYLFRRFERSLAGQSAFLLLDEAWVMLGHEVFRAKIREWLKTLRKKNCAVVLATQSLADALRSGIFSDLIESCPTRIFLPNEEAMIAGSEGQPGPRDLYAMFGLNETEIEIIRTAQKKREYFVVQPERRRLIDLALGPAALAFAGASSKQDIARIDQLAAAEGERWPFTWLSEKGIAHEAV